jgi:hypothetical protein
MYSISGLPEQADVAREMVAESLAPQILDYLHQQRIN